MALTFTKASKKRQKLRLAVFGVSGSGKTYTALRIAKGMVPQGRIAVIDSEHGASELYSDRFEFDVLNLEDHSPDRYAEALELAAKAGYDAVIIDSFTHAWYKLLEIVDQIAKAKYKGNTFSAWSEGTPAQNRLVNAILKSPFHLIATMRSSTEWSIEEVNGRKTPVRVGTNPNQGKGIEFEFTMLMEMTPDHYGKFIKDRTGKFQDKIIDKPDELLGGQLIEWLNTGAEVITPPPAKIDDATFSKHLAAIESRSGDQLTAAREKVLANKDYTEDQRAALIEAIDKRMGQAA